VSLSRADRAGHERAARLSPPRTVGSLFSGIGGLELGLEACGLGPVIWQVEYDPFCRSILARHYPGAARAVHDVRDAGAATLARVDLICGGFPCQPVSVAGKRKAQEDERWLWPEVARIAGELGPRFLFLENVPGLLTASGGSAFGEVLGSLAALGFAAEWDCFRASDVGAPHRRERWFLLAYRDDGRGEGANARGQRARVGPALAGGQDGVANAARLAQREPTDEAHAVAARGHARAAPRGERQPLADARGLSPLGRQPKRVRGSAVPPGAVARGEGMGDAEGERRRPRGLPVRAGAQQPVPGVAGFGGECEGPVGVGLADPNGARLEERERLFGDAQQERAPALGDGADGGAGPAQPRMGRGPHGIPLGMDGPWPAGRGEAQHPWEPPRTAHGVRMRPARLKALGNAVLPAEAAFAWRVLWARVMERMKGCAA